MAISTWLSNGTVEFSNVQVANKDILVCTSNVGSHRVIFVEDLKTGKRVFPSVQQHIPSGKEMDEIVLELVNQL